MHLVPFSSSVTPKDRIRLTGHNAAVLWLTGLSGSGKSTISHALEKRLSEMNIQAMVLDGDNIRKKVNKDLGLSPEDRLENVRRTAEIAKLMTQAGLITICAFINPSHQGQELVRSIIGAPQYHECYVQCTLEECIRRDPKGLYAKATSGQLKGMTGLTAPYAPPLQPELTLNSTDHSVEEMVATLVQYMQDCNIISPAPISSQGIAL